MASVEVLVTRPMVEVEPGSALGEDLDVKIWFIGEDDDLLVNGELVGR